ncbi:MAG TPA: M23 family metallopeptidase, partial [Bacteroidia bacterium]|nr:M23 family metallopeptidase [Bacteroidia bacterium]
SKALDFMILDDEMKTYSGNGTQCRDYYCYAKPVLAPGDGIVEEAVDGVEENAIGNVNMVQNWGNTIVIRHLPGLYTKLSHLKNGSLKVKKGDFVRKGDIIAQCGNSGRSPEPHIHFQVQAFPDVAARTLSYPLAYYFLHEKGKTSLESFSVPAEGKIISAAETSTLLGAAFAFQPGFRQQFVFSENKKQKKESWETVTDAYNRTYIYVVGGNAYAYFINNGTVFYFTAFYGDKNSLLYRFYLSCYHIPLVQYGNMNATDHFPLHLFAGGPAKWLQDVVAPFHVFVRKEFRMECAKSDDEYHPREITLSSSIRNFFPGRSVQSSGSEITVADGKIRRFRFSDMENGNIIDAECTEEK